MSHEGCKDREKKKGKGGRGGMMVMVDVLRVIVGANDQINI